MKTTAFWGALWMLASISVRGSDPLDLRILTDQAGHIQVSWPSTVGELYAIETSTNLSAPWQPLQGQLPLLTATSNTLSLVADASGITRFYRVAWIDTHAPQIVRVQPIPGAIAVPLQSPVRVWFEDASGVDPNSITLQLGASAPLTLVNLRLAFTNGVLVYTPV